jgi:hypothetical protein
MGTCGLAQGTAALRQGWLILRLEYVQGFFKPEKEFLPVRWGPRKYLIARQRIPDFLDAIRRGSEPREMNWSLFYLREGDWDKPVRGSPDLPKHWKALAAVESEGGKESSSWWLSLAQARLPEKRG